MVDKKGKEPTKEIAETPSTNTALASVTSFLQENESLGMEKADQSDFRTPTITMIALNSNLEDQYGNRLVDKNAGKFYCAFNKTIYTNPQVVFLTFTKENLPSYEDKDVLVQTYVLIGMTVKDHMPFRYFARKSAIGSIKDLLTTVKALNRPMWSVVVEMQAELTKMEKDAKKFTFYKLRLPVVENIDELGELQKIKELVHQYQTVVSSPEIFEDAATPPEVESDVDPDLDVKNLKSGKQPDGSEDVNPDSIPF